MTAVLIVGFVAAVGAFLGAASVTILVLGSKRFGDPS